MFSTQFGSITDPAHFADSSITSAETPLENISSNGAPHVQHCKHADLHDKSGVGTFSLMITQHLRGVVSGHERRGTVDARVFRQEMVWRRG